MESGAIRDDEPLGPCSLISRTCTTGWFDWIHGDLWLCPRGLLRYSRGISGMRSYLASGRSEIDRTPESARLKRTFTVAEMQPLVASDRRNRWYSWDQIDRATLKWGILDHSLHLDLLDGGHAKFLWMKLDGGFDILQVALSEALPGRFRVVARPIG